MAYIGLEPSNSFVSLKRQVITGDGTASYTLDHSVASVNDVAIFVNNVRQDPAGYSISGAALTLGGTIQSSDDCYVIFLGQALQTVTPGGATITGSMLNNSLISDKTALTSAPASTDEFLVSDAGTLKRVDASLVGRGKLLQVVSVSKNDTFTTTSTSFTDVTGLTADITPSSTSNKVLVTVMIGRLTTDDGGGVTAELNRGGSSIYDLGQGGATDGFAAGGGGGMSNNDRKNDVAFIQYLDSPSSTSALTYKIRIKRTSSGSAFINRWGLNDDQGAVSSITLMEIAG